MFPTSIPEIIDAVDHYTLVEGAHVEYKVYHSSVNIDALVRIMVSFANSGGGVIVIGMSNIGDEGAMIISGLSDSVKLSLNNDLQSFIESKVVNLDNWSLEYGTYLDFDFAAIIIKQSSKGMAYFCSVSDPLNRTYYYRRGNDNVMLRSQYKMVYKYMTMDAMIASLEGKCWRFWEPSRWQDKYERRFYCANYNMLTKDDFSEQRVYATCVTRTQNNEAAWKVYAGKEGMQSHCVQLELDLEELLNQLYASGYKIFERRVNYVNDGLILHLHESSNKHHSEYFQDFNFNQFLNLLSLKREAYAYENEVRLFAIEQNTEDRSLGNKSLYADLALDWGKVIRKMRVDSKCSVSELVALRHSCWSRGINPVIKGKTLPGDVGADVRRMKQVEVSLFNIDDMPGRKRIVIEP